MSASQSGEDLSWRLVSDDQLSTVDLQIRSHPINAGLFQGLKCCHSRQRGQL